MQDRISTHTNRQTFNIKHLNTTIIMDKKDETIKKYREVVKELQLRIQKQKEYYEVARDKIQELSREVGEKTELITSLKRKIGGYKTTLINQKRRLERVIDDMSKQYEALKAQYESLKKVSDGSTKLIGRYANMIHELQVTTNQKIDTWRIKYSKLEQEIQSKDDFIRTQSKAISDYCKALNEREKIIQDLRNELDLKDAMIADIKDASTSWLQRCFFWWR